MMRIIVIFLLLLGSIIVGTWINHDPGYVLISIHHWTIEASFWVACVAVILLALILHFLLALLKNILHIPERWRNWRLHRRLNQAQRKTRKGLIEFSEGHWQAAKKYLIAGASNTDLPLVNYLNAARAAEALGDVALRDQYLHQAQEAVPDATIAIELTQAELQLEHQQWEEAKTTLHALQIISPDHPYVLKLLLRLYQSTHNWSELATLLPKLKSNKITDEKEIEDMKRHTYVHLLQTYIERNEHTEIDQFILNLPKHFKQDAEILTIYTRYLLKQHQDKKAEGLIRDYLKSYRYEPLLEIYSTISSEYTRTDLIEQLLQKSPDDAILHFCLGKILIGKQLWGQAKAHLETSIHINPTSDAYHALGHLLEILQDSNAACHAYRLALECRAT
ncbi:MAG TPA: heme biosynthesis HemY N-terminal domain-containing protein [Legionellaceae bacterium]|nr:heme biosynthesis HemY N-terminal domain-containing protein [Legionellaceae bacterium]